ncbi:hypothetical protein [Sinorhizobium medicae]
MIKVIPSADWRVARANLIKNGIVTTFAPPCGVHAGATANPDVVVGIDAPIAGRDRGATASMFRNIFAHA